MREIELQNLWKTRRFHLLPLVTTAGEPLQVLDVGKINSGSGPDFLFAKLRIGRTLWLGHVEIHVRASYWYHHSHHLDEAYNNVILHVVWAEDTKVVRKDGKTIPTLALSEYFTEQEVERQHTSPLDRGTLALSCSSLLPKVPAELRNSWKMELADQRLHRKSSEVLQWVAESAQNWEQVFFRSLLKGFGLNRNGEAFASLASALPFNIVLKVRTDLTALESLFFGLSGLLDKIGVPDAYSDTLKKEYRFLRAKFKLSSDACQKPEFFSLRPGNFPTVRLSQLAVLYHGKPNLFNRVKKARSLSGIRALLQTRSSPYWDNHHVFGRACEPVVRKTTGRFTDLLILNAVIPVLDAYSSKTGRCDSEDHRKWAEGIRSEENKLVRLYLKEGVYAKNARETQALIELYKEYCQKNKCLQCRWGIYLLYGKY